MKIFFALLLVVIAVLLFGWGGLIVGGLAGIISYEVYRDYTSGTDPPVKFARR